MEIEIHDHFKCVLCGFEWTPAHDIEFIDSETAWKDSNGDLYCSERCAETDEMVLKADCQERESFPVGNVTPGYGGKSWQKEILTKIFRGGRNANKNMGHSKAFQDH